MKEALLYEKLSANLAHCYLCAHQCRIKEGKFGFCGVRQNIQGKLYTHVYGKLVAAHIDPIEKKPLYHFLPGSSSFSIATIGCNFRCGFCQNWQISQADFKQGLSPSLDSARGKKGTVPEFSGEEFTPERIVDLAIKNNCRSISYTYTEPTIFFEYALETARLAKKSGLRNIFS